MPPLATELSCRRTWNDLQRHITSASSLSAFPKSSEDAPLPTFFSITFVQCLWSDSCNYWHYNHSFYLLTYFLTGNPVHISDCDNGQTSLQLPAAHTAPPPVGQRKTMAFFTHQIQQRPRHQLTAILATGVVPIKFSHGDSTCTIIKRMKTYHRLTAPSDDHQIHSQNH